MSTLWYVDALDPSEVLSRFEPDREAARALVERLFPGRTVVSGDSTVLTEIARDPVAGGSADNTVEQVYVGSYPGVTVVSSPRLMTKIPSQLPSWWLRTPASRCTYLLASHPPGAWGSFAAWENGVLRRSFGANTIEFYEDTGLPFTWERPYWAGDHPIRWPAGIVVPSDPLPFHPRKLVEEAHAAWLGFRYVGRRDDEIDPGTIRLWSFTVGTPSPSLSEPVTAPRRRWWQRRAVR